MLWTSSDRSTDPKSHWKKFYETLPELSSLTVGTLYSLVSADGDGTCVFRVDKKIDEDSYKVGYRDYNVKRKPNSNAGVSWPCSSPYDVSYDHDAEALLFVNRRKGTSFSIVGGSLYAPDNCRVISLEKPPKVKTEDTGCGMPMDDWYEPSPLSPGDLSDVQLFVQQKTASVRAWRHGDGIVLDYVPTLERTGCDWPRRQSLSKLAAFVHLVQDHGLSEKSARLIVSQADAGVVRKYRIKHAAGYGDGMQDNVGAPQFPDAYYGSPDAQFGNVQQMPSQEMFMNVPSMQPTGNLQDQQSNWKPSGPDQHVMGQANQAAQTGQKEVFDTSMLKGLLKSVREDSLINRHLPALMTALDKIGRLLFLFYWHGEEFEDRYGKSDMPELEDTLRNVFESLGDLVLFLREKEVRPFGPSGLLGSPDIDAASHG